MFNEAIMSGGGGGSRVFNIATARYVSNNILKTFMLYDEKTQNIKIQHENKPDGMFLNVTTVIGGNSSVNVSKDCTVFYLFSDGVMTTPIRRHMNAGETFSVYTQYGDINVFAIED